MKSKPKKIKSKPKSKKVLKKRNPNSQHYVDNAFFFQEILDYRKLCDEAKKKGEEQPDIPETIGKCISDIAHQLAQKHNFMPYHYKDEMILDGIWTAIRAVKRNKFDPNVGTNPFAYFTQVIWWSFLRTIEKEKKEKYIRYKQIDLKTTEEMIGIEGEGIDIATLIPDDLHEFILDYEKKNLTQKKKSTKKKKIKTELISLFFIF